MVIKHVVLVCGSEENSDKFYGQLLGLAKINSKILPRELSRQIFDLDSELQVINYADDTTRFEIFINSKKSCDVERIGHVCLAIEDMEAFIKKCHALEADTLQIQKGDRLLLFIKDFDGNLFEIIAKNQ